MKIKSRRRLAVPENSALSDLAFLLIIYFIVIAGFDVNKGLLMNLPSKDSSRLIAREEIMRYFLDDSGALYLANEKRNIAVVEKEIARAVSLHPNMAIVLDVAPAAPWQNVVSFVELAERLKVETFSFKLKSSGGEGL
jgi:biopolymer transport protein ExbD